MTFEELDEIAAKHGLIKKETAKSWKYYVEHQIFPNGSDLLIVLEIGVDDFDKVMLFNKLGTLVYSPGYCTLFNEKGDLGEILDVSVDKIDKFISERQKTFDLMLSNMLTKSIEKSESTLRELLK